MDHQLGGRRRADREAPARARGGQRPIGRREGIAARPVDRQARECRHTARRDGGRCIRSALEVPAAQRERHRRAVARDHVVRYASSTSTVTAGPIAGPAVASVGCCPKTTWLAAAGLTAMPDAVPVIE